MFEITSTAIAERYPYDVSSDNFNLTPSIKSKRTGKRQQLRTHADKGECCEAKQNIKFKFNKK